MNTITILVCAVLLTSPMHAIAQHIPVRASDQIDLMTYTPPQVYQDQMVIRVQTTSQDQLDALLPLVESVWTESVGVGDLDIQIKRSNLKAIDAMGIPLSVLVEDLQTEANKSWSEMLQAQQRLGPLQRQGELVHNDLWFANFKQINDIAQYLNNIASLRPDLASTSIIGQSLQGRDMFGITISGPDTVENPRADRPIAFLFSTVHAREWIAPMTTSYFASKLVEDYDSDPRVRTLLDSMRVLIVPVANPDGYVYTWTDQRFWRKNRRFNGGSYGVDINRNWGYQWGGPGASGSPSSDTYRGPSAFSEPETGVLRDTALALGDKLVAHIDYHAFGQLILYPWGYTPDPPLEPDRTYFEVLTKELSSIIRAVDRKFYNPIQAEQLYVTSGDSIDWFYGELGINSLTIELRPDVGGFDPPPEIILPNAIENYEAVKKFLERSIEPISFWHRSFPTHRANTPLEISVMAFDGLEELDLASPKLMLRVGPDSEFSAIDMTLTAQNTFTATAPAMACGEVLEYYFQTTTTEGVVHTFPSQGATSPIEVLADQLVTSTIDTLETDTGWSVGDPTDTATSGIWTRLDPQEVMTAQGDIAQPANNHTPSGTLCWITDGVAGIDENDRDVDNGATSLISPMLDASRVDDPYISFWYWLYRSDDRYPSLRVDLSNDNGDTWTTVEHLDGMNQDWTQHQFRIASELTPTDQMRIRFVAFDGGVDGVVEAGIDDLTIAFYGCPSTNPADFNNDGELDFLDIQAFLSYFTNQNLLADLNDDGQLDFLDITIFISAYNSGRP